MVDPKNTTVPDTPLGNRTKPQAQWQEYNERVHNIIAGGISALEKKFGTKLDHPKVSYDLKGLTAGQAICSENKIRLNLQAFEIECEDMMENTVPHELAHLYAHKHFGRGIKSHGGQWKSVMRALGIKPERCHSYALRKARKHRRFSRHCGKCGHIFKVTNILINKMKRGLTYTHKGCGGKLVKGPVS